MSEGVGGEGGEREFRPRPFDRAEAGGIRKSRERSRRAENDAKTVRTKRKNDPPGGGSGIFMRKTKKRGQNCCKSDVKMV